MYIYAEWSSCIFVNKALEVAVRIAYKHYSKEDWKSPPLPGLLSQILKVYLWKLVEMYGVITKHCSLGSLLWQISSRLCVNWFGEFFCGVGVLFLTGCHLKHFWLPQVLVKSTVVFPRKWKVIFKKYVINSSYISYLLNVKICNVLPNTRRNMPANWHCLQQCKT